MDGKYFITAIGITGVTIIETAALITGVDGAYLAGCVGAISALVGGCIGVTIGSINKNQEDAN